ncbi:MAG: site-2 protease family protein [Ruminococcus sp.]|nr:site-2 protease family protein [Ruminococcus sp.]MDE6539656.1 site-2 protease family protein [Ruminococcus sp.]
MGIIIAVIIFGLIVMVHEFGHFICAKLSGVRVLEFSIGMGFKLLQKQIGETKYSLRLLPLGGFCAMEGEDEDSDDPHSFRSAKLWKRMIILVAGAGMNFILGFVAIVIMMSMLSSVPTRQIEGFSAIQLEDGTLERRSGSYDSGLRHDDIFYKIDDTRIFSMLDINYILSASPTNVHDVTVIRDGEKVEFDNVTFENASGGTVDFGLVQKEKNPLTIIKGSGEMFMSMGHIVGMSLKQLVSGQAKKEDISGPVGVVTAINETTQESEDIKDTIFQLIYMTSLITINIGIFNLLPIPGLDGGRLIFCFIELIRRKPVKPEHEGYVHLAGMVLLFGIMIMATYNDIVRLITGGV